MSEIDTDHASAIEEAHRLAALELQLAKSRVVIPEDWDKENCYECGNPIPAERLKAVRTCYCVYCQNRREKSLR